jgi:hypothetical protein
MKLLNALAGSMFAAALVAAPAAFSAEPMKKHDMSAMNQDKDAFMKSCDMDRDGMMSKAEMHAHMDRMFDKMDAKKTGKLDSKQTEAFLKEFARQSGG